MQAHTEVTPCPVSRPDCNNDERNVYVHLNETHLHAYDDTSNVQYTTELQLHLNQVKPRKRPGAKRRTAFNPSADIYEDGGKDEGQDCGSEMEKQAMARMGSQSRQSTIFAHPAQRLHGEVSIQGKLNATRPRRKRVSQLLAEMQSTTAEKAGDEDGDVCQEERDRPGVLRKNPRRRTIYIPSEDTTIMTIHPGAPSDKSEGAKLKPLHSGLTLAVLPELALDAPIPPAQIKKAPRKSLAAAPKRCPLQQTLRPLQDVSFLEDIMGTGGGKENLPPGKLLDAPVEFKAVSTIEPRSKQVKALRAGHHHGILAETTASRSIRKAGTAAESSAISSTAAPRVKAADCRKRNVSSPTDHAFPTKSLKAKVNSTAAREVLKQARHELFASSSAPRTRLANRSSESSPRMIQQKKAEKVPSKIRIPPIPEESKGHREKYPVLTEDLSRPELYESEWLSHQEIAITQLLNGLFDSTKSKHEAADQEAGHLRKQLLSSYHQPEVPLLHKRLQASLLYGALAVPRNVLAQALRLKDDVGLRRKFLDLWLDTYDLSVLKAAAETVVGREVGPSSRLSGGSTTSESEERQMRAERRAIEAFLDTFLVRNEDAVRPRTGVGTIASIARGDINNDEVGSHAWTWRRTVLRSLMLIHLLDKAKAHDMIPHCLFQGTSPHKSSVSVLHALSSMLLPSLGDVLRPLGHLTYHVQSVQYPLEEYVYHVDNLATGLRDGVLLTRLVEILLYPPSQLEPQSYGDTVTITMPTGDVLISVPDVNQNELWVLSQHLRFPCISRAQKLYNVQIALSALEGVKGVAGRVVEDVKADDIVDGHREKTLSLLWGLVSKCGLDRLIDFKELEKEIQRFRETWHTQHPDDNEDTEDEEPTSSLSGLALYTYYLQTWARTIGRLHNLRITNLTTSFASGAALTAIVDTYLPYFPIARPSPSTTSSSSTSTSPSLATKLKTIGCSASFVALYTPSPSPPTASVTTNAYPIPSRDFTITSLSFLAARLLPHARLHRAALTIQHFYRLRLQKREVSERVALMRLAVHCATVVQTRERVVGAAVVLQRAWRAALERRIAMLVGGVVTVQKMARGWLARRRVGGRGKGTARKMDGARAGW